MAELGGAIRPWLDRFGADVCVVGGSIAASWDLIEQPLREGMDLPSTSRIALRRAELGEEAGLRGAADAWHDAERAASHPTHARRRGAAERGGIARR